MRDTWLFNDLIKHCLIEHSEKLLMMNRLFLVVNHFKWTPGNPENNILFVARSFPACKNRERWCH